MNSEEVPPAEMVYLREVKDCKGLRKAVKAEAQKNEIYFDNSY